MGKISKLIGDEVGQILKMSESDRMARAEEMGFDTSSWYHGGTKGKMSQIDMNKLGKNTGTPASKEAFFLTRSKDDASKYADMSSGEVHELLFRPENTAVLDWSQIGVPIRSNNGQRILAGILMDAKEQGMGALRIKNSFDTADGAESAADTLAVLNPSLLRYKEAAFDPAKKTSSNLMASVAPVGAGIGYDALSPQQAVESTISPTNPSAPSPQMLANMPYNKDQIRAPIHPLAAKAAGYFDKYNRSIKETPAEYLMPEAPAEWANKLAYDGKTKISDRLLAALGML